MIKLLKAEDSWEQSHFATVLAALLITQGEFSGYPDILGLGQSFSLATDYGNNTVLP